jgi:hypothetical protein
MSFELMDGEEVGDRVEGAAVKVPLWWQALKALAVFLLELLPRGER